MTDVDYVIIGGGVVGRAISLALRRRGENSVAVVEACPKDLVENQSTRNSGVIHAGIYYKRASRPKKAQMCVAGNRLLYEFCREFAVPHAQTGKLVVAATEREVDYLRDVLETAVENGVPDVRLLDKAEHRAIEPRIAAVRSLYVPTSGVIDAFAYLEQLRLCAASHDLFGARVMAIRRAASGFEVTTRTQGRIEQFFARWVINSAGLHADEVARMIDPTSPYTIMPVRGESARFNTSTRAELDVRRMNVYRAPHGFYKDTGKAADVSFAEFKDLLARGLVVDTVGVHLTPTLDADGQLSTTMTVSPAIVTGIEKTDLRSSHTLAHYVSRVSGYFPQLRETDLELGYAGIQARLPNELDWVIEPSRGNPRFINLIGLDSPALTASLAIAQHVVEEMLV